MKETWRIIENFTNYEISNLGHVRNIKTGKIRKLQKHRDGYLNIMLKSDIDGKFYSCFIHRLVAKAFIPNHNNYKEVNHKNEDKSCNIVENLEWCNRSYNVNYGTRVLRAAIKNTNGKKSKKVYQYDLRGNFINEFPSVSEVERVYKLRNVSEVCRGKRKSAGGFIWRYDKI